MRAGLGLVWNQELEGAWEIGTRVAGTVLIRAASPLLPLLLKQMNSLLHFILVSLKIQSPKIKDIFSLIDAISQALPV